MTMMSECNHRWVLNKSLRRVCKHCGEFKVDDIYAKKLTPDYGLLMAEMVGWNAHIVVMSWIWLIILGDILAISVHGMF